MRTIGALPGSWRVKHDIVSPELAKVLYPIVLELASKGQGPAGIARQLSAVYQPSISPGTVRHWMVGDRNPLGGKVRNLFKQEPSPALRVVLGADFGGGCTLTHDWIVKLEVTDRDFAEAFNSSMATLLSRETPNKILIKRFRVKRLPMYVVRYACKALVELLRLPLSKLLEIAFKFPREFLRGFFDAEGHVDVGCTKSFSLKVGATNTDRTMLIKIKRMLKKELGIDSYLNKKRAAGSVMVIRSRTFALRRTSYELIMSSRESVKKFTEEVGFTIFRKSQKAKDALFIVVKFKPKDRSAVWKQLYYKVAGEWVRRDWAEKQNQRVLCQGCRPSPARPVV